MLTGYSIGGWVLWLSLSTRLVSLSGRTLRTWCWYAFCATPFRQHAGLFSYGYYPSLPDRPHCNNWVRPLIQNIAEHFFQSEFTRLCGIFSILACSEASNGLSHTCLIVSCSGSGNPRISQCCTVSLIYFIFPLLHFCYGCTHRGFSSAILLHVKHWTADRNL